jgi:hypothetical protein
MCCLCLLACSCLPHHQLRKSYPLKSLHDVRISSFARSAAAQQQGSKGHAAAGHDQQQQQVLLEVRCASHHNAPEHRGRYVLANMQAAMFAVSLAFQLLRCAHGASRGRHGTGFAAALSAVHASQLCSRHG